MSEREDVRYQRTRSAGLAAVALLIVLVILLDHARRPGPVVALCLIAAGLLVSGLRAGAPGAPDGPRRGRLVLLLLLLPTLVQFHVAGGRINGDGVMYYVYVRSLAMDKDLEFTNEYAHYGLLERADLKVPTRTGRRRSIFAAGPGLLWLPFFAVGEVAGRGAALLGREVDLSGYGPVHVNAVALGSLLLGFLAVLLIHEVLARHFSMGTALLAAVLSWLATFLHWYMVHQPTMSHASSAFGAALVVWWWDGHRDAPSVSSHAVLGLLLGLGMCLRWQNAVLVLLPALDLLRRLFREPRAWPRLLPATLALGGVLALGALPQLVAWKVIYGEWLLRHPPHGADFLRLGHPFVMETLFSSRHGLLSWTPILWLGYLGFWPLARRHPQVAFPLLVPLALMTYVNMCSGDWWAGGSFSNRRFDSLLPVLAYGMAAALDAIALAFARHGALTLAAAVVPLVAWNVLSLESLRRGAVAREPAVSFPRLVGGAASVLAEHAGSPQTWPASWIFALRERRPPSQYDRLVGRYLFYRQNNLGGRVDLGRPGDEALLGEGWGAPEELGEIGFRRVHHAARLFAPLDVPEELEVAVHGAGEGAAAEIAVEVNGQPAGRLTLTSAWSAPALRVPRELWRRELNQVVLSTRGPRLLIDAVQFTRASAGDDAQGFRAR